MKFCEFHWKGDKTLIKLDTIISVCSDKTTGSVITVSTADEYFVDESYEDIKKLLEEES